MPPWPLMTQCTIALAVQVLAHKLTVLLRRLVVDRTFRFHAPRTEFLERTIALDALPGSSGTLFANGVNLRHLVAICSHSHVILNTKCSQGATCVRDRVSIKAKSRARAAQSVTFHITLYADKVQAVPIESWKVCPCERYRPVCAP
jgi:hypothetical protein